MEDFDNVISSSFRPYSIFTMNTVTSQLEIDCGMVFLVPCFKKLYKRDRGSKGDQDGRKKYQAFRELTYIYYMSDYRSPYILLDEKTRHEEAFRDSELSADWKRDNVVIECIKVYEKRQDDLMPSFGFLNELRVGVDLGKNVVKMINKNLANMLKNLVEAQEKEISGGKSTEAFIKNEETGNFDPNPESLIHKLPAIKKELDSIMSYSANLPKTLKQVSELQERVRRESSAAFTVYGGRELNNREATQEDLIVLKEKQKSK